MLDEDIHIKRIELRKELINKARKAIYIQGTHPAEWETDPEIVECAKSCGIEDELTHIAELAYKGWRGDYQRHLFNG